jgi:DnaA family protein
MQQLPLDIRTAAHAVFENFYPGRNALAVATLERAAIAASPSLLWLHGPEHTGKSHLLQATVTRAHALGAATAFLPLRELRARSPAVLDGMGTLALVALDDLDAVSGDAGWEVALFRLYEELLPRGARMLAAAGRPPAQAGIALPDLRSRLSGAAVFALEPLTEAECLQALHLRAEWRGLTLPEETARYLLARVERDAATLFGWLDRLDQASLARQKRLTVPFVRSVLERG